MSDPAVNELARVALFDGLATSDLEVIAGFLQPESYTAGRIIVEQGTAGYVFYVIRKGEAEIIQSGKVLGALDAGDFFGEISLMSDDGKRTATVVARSDVELWAMFGTNFRELLAKHAAVGSALQDAVSRRLSRA